MAGGTPAKHLGDITKSTTQQTCNTYKNNSKSKNPSEPAKCFYCMTKLITKERTFLF